MLSAAVHSEAAWVLWTRGLHGPEIAVLRHRGNPPVLNDAEQARSLGLPRRIEPDDAVLPLRAIERLYPAPDDAGRPK